MKIENWLLTSIGIAAAIGAGLLLRQNPVTPIAGPVKGFCVSGQELRYAITYSSKAKMFSPFTPSGQDVAFSFDGELRINCIAESKQAITRRLNLSFSRYHDNEGRTKPETVVFYETVSIPSQQHSLLFTPQTPLLSRHLARDLVSKSQWHFGDSNTWQQVETDLSGKVAVTYERSANAAGQIVLNKSQFHVTQSGEKEAAKAFLPSSTATFAFDQNYILQQATIDLDTAITMNGQNLAQNQTQVTWSQPKISRLSISLAKEKDVVQTLTKSADAVDDFAATSSQERAERSLQMNELGGLRWVDLETMLQKPKGQDQTKLFLKLRAFFKLYPAEADRAQALLAEGTVSQDSFRTLALALAKTGNIEAERTLQKAFESKAEAQADQVYLLGLLGLAVNPSLELETWLRDQTTQPNADIQQTSRLALGNVSANLRFTHSDIFMQNQSQEIERLAASKTNIETINTLSALTNYGGDAILSAVATALSDKDAQIRSHALSSLRFVDTTEAEQALIKGLSDDDTIVQHAAAHELSFRDLSETSLSAVSKKVHGNATEILQSAYLSIMQRNMTQHPNLEQDVKFLANNSIFNSVRSQAQNILASSSR